MCSCDSKVIPLALVSATNSFSKSGSYRKKVIVSLYLKGINTTCWYGPYSKCIPFFEQVYNRSGNLSKVRYKLIVIVSCTHELLNLFEGSKYGPIFNFSYFSWVYFHLDIANLMTKILNLSSFKFTLLLFIKQSVVAKSLQCINKVSLIILNSLTIYNYII